MITRYETDAIAVLLKEEPIIMLSLPTNRPLPHIPRLISALPGTRARSIIERDHTVTSPSYTRGYPLVAARGEG